MKIEHRTSLLRAMVRFARADSGASAIEFAFVAPPLIFLMLAIIEYSIIFHLQSLATHAANEAARKVKTGADYCGDGTAQQACIERTARAIMGTWVGPTRPLTVTPTNMGTIGGGVTGGAISARDELVLYRVGIDWTPITPFIFSVGMRGGVVPIYGVALVKNEM